MNIGIFDSGIGGVTVLKEIVKILPNENYIYYSDSKNNPYGDKNDDEIIKVCEDIVEKLINKDCKVIVIACNTASAKCVEYLRKKYTNIPFIAIEPAYKMVYDYAYDEPTLIMATKGTIESEKFNLLYTKYNNNKTDILACVGLANIIENCNSDNNEILKEYLNKNLIQYKGNVKNVVLGCTHYPLIKDKIKEVLGNGITFFDGAPNLAKHLKDVLQENNILENNEGKIEFIDSNNSEEKRQRFYNYLKETTEIKAVIFDMDGTLIDSELIKENGWKYAGKQVGINIDDEIMLKIRGTNKAFIEKFLSDRFNNSFDFNQLYEIREQYINKHINEYGMQGKKGLNEILNYLKENDYKIALASSSSEDIIKRYLKQLNVYDLFDVIIGGDMVKEGKPDPEIYLTAAKLLNVNPKNCIGVEDSNNGILSVYRAGMKPIFIKDLDEPSNKTINMTYKSCESLMELMNFLDKLKNV